MTLLPAAVLAALIVTDTFGAAAGNLTLDARAAGLVAAVIAIALRLPMLAVLVTAAAVTALVRLLVC
jgi:branched-subunit amino acid transport protein